MRKTKIVCTLGPASADEKVMEAMLRAGMNVARFNFSHGTHESHREMMQRFRAVRDRLGSRVETRFSSRAFTAAKASSGRRTTTAWPSWLPTKA